MSYRIVTDATADLSADVMRDMCDVTIIPMEVRVGEMSLTFSTGDDEAVTSFYRQLREGAAATTSQINVDTFLQIFRSILEGGEDILYLGFSSALSGTLNNAHLAASMLCEDFPERTIQCIDSRCASVEEGFLIHEAAMRFREGFGLSGLADWVEAHKTAVWQWFSVDSMSHLLQGGRVLSAIGGLGDALQIKPLLHVEADGSLKVVGKAHGKAGAMKKMLTQTFETYRPAKGNLFLIGHADCPEDAAKLKELILTHEEKADVRISQIGPVIGAHTGPGMLAIVYWGDVRQ